MKIAVCEIADTEKVKYPRRLAIWKMSLPKLAKSFVEHCRRPHANVLRVIEAASLKEVEFVKAIVAGEFLLLIVSAPGLKELAENDTLPFVETPWIHINGLCAELEHFGRPGRN